MTLYMFFYIIIFTPFIFFSLMNIFDNTKINSSCAFYFFTSLILNFILPIFFFNFKNLIFSTLISLILLSFIVILSFRLYQKNKNSLTYTIPAMCFTYYTFCYILATNLNCL